MKLGLIFSDKNSDITEDIKSLNEILRPFSAELLILKDFSFVDENIIQCGNCNELAQKSDIIIAFGGDGTIIRASKIGAIYNKAVLGVNKGNLGFLASLEKQELHKLKYLFTHNFTIRDNIILECIIDGYSFFAVNDIVITRDIKSRVVDYTVYRERQHNICKYRADGLIFSTAIGSTAYSLSAGGSIIEPELECIEIVPICPHNIFARNHLISSRDPFFVKFELKENSKICIFEDGNLCFSGCTNNEIMIRRSKRNAKFIVFPDYDFYGNVEKKLYQKNF